MMVLFFLANETLWAGKKSDVRRFRKKFEIKACESRGKRRTFFVRRNDEGYA
jgi:hypothetical protein